jgi:glycosyltransferase involved in cell wall biosynthesis
VGQLLRAPARAFSGLGWTVRHHAWPAATLAKALVVWVQSLALARWMAEDGVAHVHAHWATMPTTAAVLASRHLGVRFSFTAHAWDIFVRNPSLKAKVELAERIFTCTEYNRRYLAHWRPELKDKVLCAYHGVDLGRFQAPSPGGHAADPEPLFLSVGRLVDTKGFDVLLAAYRLLRDRGCAFRALIVGEGPLRRSLQRRIRRAGLEGCVALRPVLTREALRALYAQAFAFVLPCVVARNGDRDGIPNVILEAMAMRLPVVSTMVSGIPEAVQDRRTGLLVPPRDPSAVADALELLLRRRSFAAVLGDHGRMWASTSFDAREHLQRLAGEMARLLAIPRAPANLLYVIWSLEVGGAERIVESLASGIDRRRFVPSVACLNRPGRLAETLRAQGIPVVALDKRPGCDRTLLWRLVRLMKRLRVDVVHTHLWGANVWGRLAARLAGVPVVLAHEHGLQPWRGRLHWWIDRRLLGASDRVLFVSEEVRRDYRARTGASAQRCVLVPNGIAWNARGLDRESARRQLGWREDERVIVSIGRLAPEKGHEDLLHAAALLRGQGEALRVVLIGDGPQRQALADLQARHGLNGGVTFAGTQDDVAPWLLAADAYVQPSRREALSLALLEAMAAGTPVIATHVGDAARLIRHGREGYLVPPADPEALAGMLREVLRRPQEARRVAAAAQQLVRQAYSRERMLDAVQALYAELLDAHTRTRRRR